MATEDQKVISLTARINAEDDAEHIWSAVEAIDQVLQRYRPKARGLAILYTSTILAARMLEAKTERDQQDATKH